MGQTFGDVLSVVQGAAMAAGAAVAEVGSAGVLTAGAAPALAGAAALAAHGSMMAAKGAASLASNRGRVYANRVSNQQAPSVKQQAEGVKGKLNNGRNSVTIKTAKGHTRYDLAGKDHFGVPTPHKQAYKNNTVNGVVKSVSRVSKKANPMDKQDVRTVRRYLSR